MKSRFMALLGSAIAATCFITTAKAQEQIPVETDTAYRTSEMPLAFAAKVAGFTRIEVTGYDQDGFNLAASYDDGDNATFATLYVYRVGIEDPRIWADRATTGMMSGRQLGIPSVNQAKLGTFSPPDRSGSDSGYLLVAPLEKSDWVSTGLALFMHDGWIIKLRMSSQTLIPADLETRMLEFLEALEIDTAAQANPEFQTMRNCDGSLSFDDKAKLHELSLSSTLIYGTIFNMASEKSRKKGERKTREPACRAGYTDHYTVYAYPDDANGYVMAFGDSGYSALIGQFDMKGLMKPPRGYAVTFANGISTEVFPPFDRKPTPAQVEAILGQVGPVVRIDTRPGSEGGSTILMPATEKD